jgi:hypothetical protein
MQKEREKAERLLCDMVIPFLEQVATHRSSSDTSGFQPADLTSTKHPVLDFLQLDALKQLNLFAAFSEEALSNAKAQAKAKATKKMEAEANYAQAQSSNSKSQLTRWTNEATKTAKTLSKLQHVLKVVEKTGVAGAKLVVSAAKTDVVVSGRAARASRAAKGRTKVETTNAKGSPSKANLKLFVEMALTAEPRIDAQLRDSFDVRFPYEFGKTDAFEKRSGGYGFSKQQLPFSVVWLYLANLRERNPLLFQASCRHYLSGMAKKHSQATTNLATSHSKLRESQREEAAANAGGLPLDKIEAKLKKFQKQIVDRTGLESEAVDNLATVQQMVAEYLQDMPARADGSDDEGCDGDNGKDGDEGNHSGAASAAASASAASASAAGTEGVCVKDAGATAK